MKRSIPILAVAALLASAAASSCILEQDRPACTGPHCFPVSCPDGGGATCRRHTPSDPSAATCPGADGSADAGTGEPQPATDPADPADPTGEGAPGAGPEPVPDGGCRDDGGCGAGQRCADGACVAVCQTECCAQADCGAGEVCLDGACRKGCTHRCDCAAGEVCEQGACAVPAAPPSTACQTDCDCDYHAGERCVGGSCQQQGS